MYILKIHYSHAFGMGEKRVEVKINNLQENLIDICSRKIDGIHILSFTEYYGKSDQYAVEKIVPYILKDGIYNWNVPYGDITVEEFIQTHHLLESDWLEVDVDNVGSGPAFLDALYQEWVQFGTIACDVVDWVGRGITVATIVSFVRKSFGTKKENKPTVKELYNFLMYRKKWKKDVLEEQLHIQPVFLEYLLNVFGFEIDNMKEYYNINYKKHENYIKAEKDYISKLYDNHGTNINWYGTNERVENINIQLLYYNILCQDIPHSWEEEKERLTSLAMSNDMYLELGEDSSYIKIKNELGEGFDIDNVNQLWDSLSDYSDSLMNKILKIEESLDREVHSK